jgi:hypothetical protein
MFWTTFLRFTLWVLYAVADNFANRWRGEKSPQSHVGEVRPKLEETFYGRISPLPMLRNAQEHSAHLAALIEISCNCLVPKDSTNRRR